MKGEGGFAAYPEYKDSGVDWLREVPEHWRAKRMRYVVDISPSKGQVAHLAESTAVTFVPMESVGTDGQIDLSDERELASVYNGFTYFADGDVVVAKVTPCFENGKAALLRGLRNGIGFGTTELTTLRPGHSTDPKWLFYLVRSYDIRELGKAWMFGVAGLKRIPDDFFRDIPIPSPPIPEQQAIAAFLERETAKIDTLIGKQQRLIELLTEKRHAVISRAVTKGLDDTVPMKDSGIDWLGDVPKHWRLSRLKFEATDIVDCLHATPQYEEDGQYPAIRTADIEPGKVLIDNARLVSAQQYLLWTARLKPLANDILYSREGERFGIAALVPHGASLCISQRMMLFRIARTQVSAYIMWQLNCRHVYAQAASDIIGATSPHVNVEKIKNFLLAVPPRDEQERIVHYLDGETAKIDALTGKANQSIDLMRERRSALISAAVTGKIDVRGSA